MANTTPVKNRTKKRTLGATTAKKIQIPIKRKVLAKAKPAREKDPIYKPKKQSAKVGPKSNDRIYAIVDRIFRDMPLAGGITATFCFIAVMFVGTPAVAVSTVIMMVFAVLTVFWYTLAPHYLSETAISKGYHMKGYEAGAAIALIIGVAIIGGWLVRSYLFS